MTKCTAENKGYSFTGIYSSNKDAVTNALIAIRQKYPQCKFYIVDEFNGYSVYGDKLYLMIISKERLEDINFNHSLEVERIQDECFKKIKYLNSARDIRLKRIYELEKNINEYKEHRK